MRTTLRHKRNDDVRAASSQIFRRGSYEPRGQTLEQVARQPKLGYMTCIRHRRFTLAFGERSAQLTGAAVLKRIMEESFDPYRSTLTKSRRRPAIRAASEQHIRANRALRGDVCDDIRFTFRVGHALLSLLLSLSLPLANIGRTCELRSCVCSVPEIERRARERARGNVL